MLQVTGTKARVRLAGAGNASSSSSSSSSRPTGSARRRPRRRTETQPPPPTTRRRRRRPTTATTSTAPPPRRPTQTDAATQARARDPSPRQPPPTAAWTVPDSDRTLPPSEPPTPRSLDPQSLPSTGRASVHSQASVTSAQHRTQQVRQAWAKEEEAAHTRDIPTLPTAAMAPGSAATARRGQEPVPRMGRGMHTARQLRGDESIEDLMQALRDVDQSPPKGTHAGAQSNGSKPVLAQSNGSKLPLARNNSANPPSARSNTSNPPSARSSTSNPPSARSSTSNPPVPRATIPFAQPAPAPAPIPSRTAISTSKSLQSKRKLENIMSFLDQVESTLQSPPVPSPMTSPPSSLQSSGPFPIYSASLEDVTPDLPTSATALVAASVFDGVKSRLLHMKQTLAQRDRQLADVRTELDENHGLMRHKLAEQKSEYETVIERHLSFIDRLLKDKEQLSVKCEEVTTQVMSMERTHVQQLEAAREAHARDIKRRKETWVASERARREGWIAEKTKSIKAMTIKGLEPEIERLMTAHKQDVHRLETEHREALQKQKDADAAATQRAIEQTRREMLRERDEVLAKERDAAATRAREQIARYEDMLQETRERGHRDTEKDRARVRTEMRAEIANLETQLAKYRAKEDVRLGEFREKHAEQMREQERRHTRALEDARKRAHIERDQWQTQLVKKLNDQLAQKEAEMRKRMNKERDEELEMVVQRLGDESVGVHRKTQYEHEKNLERERAAHAEQLSAVRSELKQWRGRFVALQKAHDDAEEREHSAGSRLSAAQLRTAELERRAKTAELQLADMGDRLAKHEDAAALQQERATAVLRDRVQQLQDVVGEERRRLEVVQSTHELEVQRIVGEHDRAKAAELEALEQRVREMIERKDGAIAGLKRSLSAKDAQLREAELSMERHRIDMMRELQ